MEALHISKILRSQAWERAKGELKAMEHTFYGSLNSRPEQYQELTGKVEEFIVAVEEHELHT